MSATLPSYVTILFTGLKVKRDPGVKRTEAEDQFVKQLKTVSTVLVKRDATLRLGSLTDYNNFITWYEDTIGRVGWFDATDPLTQTTKSMRIVGGALEEVPKKKNMGLWNIGCQLETYG